jgi:3-demethoxyubiquinol 3-hydroxylase
LNKRDQKTIRRILKVNHAGEYGAIRIYKAQLWFARRWYPDIVDFLEETLGHEIRHCREFFAAMPERNTRPCRIMSLWGNGGYVLGAVTALFGAQSIWVCTSAVEETVHKHLLDQLAFIEGKDEELSALINSIMAEEIHHLEYANSKIVDERKPGQILRSTISVVTEILIWLSTWGDSRTMAREISRNPDI